MTWMCKSVAAPERWSALVLAAGAGERLGGVPKPLIVLDGQPLIARLIDALTQTGAHEVVVVLGHHATRIAEVLAQPALASRIARVLRVEPPGEQALSLQRGLAALDARSDAAMVCLADQPLVDADALRDLLSAYAQRPAQVDMVLPWIGAGAGEDAGASADAGEGASASAGEGTPGNPVMLTRTLIDELCARQAPLGGQAWRRQNPQRVYRWPSDNRAYVTDLDTLADVEALRRSGRAIRLP